MSTHFYPEQVWTKLPDLNRNCLSFRICTCRMVLWSPETFGSHWAHGLPSWHPAVGCQTSASAVTVIAPSCLHRNVQHMYERCSPATRVATREPSIKVEIKHFMVDHRKYQPTIEWFVSREFNVRLQRPTPIITWRMQIKNDESTSEAPCLCELQLHLLPARIILSKTNPSNTLANGVYSSVASSAPSGKPSCANES